MRKKIVAFVFAAALLIAVAVPVFGAGVTASANGGGCPKGDDWFLAPVGALIPDFDRGNLKDQNGDGYVCARFNPGHADGSWVVKDNTNKLPPP